MKTFDTKSVTFDKKIDILEHIFDNMIIQNHNLGSVGYMLGGDTGVGKTSFIKDLSKILGLELILVETPHLIEEHIIRIPFIVFKGETEKKDEFSVEGGPEFDVKLAKSNLHTQLTSARKLPDAQYLKAIYNDQDDTAKIFEQLGGSQKEIPPELKKIRAGYDCILFLDEYFRQTSNSIRNMLRSILNGRLGSDEIPKNIYVIFASNLVDEGIGDIMSNENFRLLNFKAPDKEEWFSYIVSKFKRDKNIKLNDDIIDDFYNIINNENLSHDDVEADVRISPRRWEQLLLYISSSLPVKDEKDASHLLRNIQINFRDYDSGKQAVIADKVLAAVKKLIKKTSNIESGQISSSGEWRDTLKHQIEQKIKLGESRKYIPVIAGLPGAGKTQNIHKLSIELNMVPVVIEVQNLSAEDVIGIPISKNIGKGDIAVKFSKPPLYNDIMTQIHNGEKKHLMMLKEAYPEDVAKQKEVEFKKAKFKYLIFFDEMNRTKTKVFNAIRRILLEKSFGDNLSLPEGSVIVGAINPSGQGTIKLTKHMKDVLDIIPTGINWNKFKNDHVDKIDFSHIVNKKSIDIVKRVFNAFVEHFRVRKSEIADADPHFFLNISDSPLYMSPREYSNMITNSVQTLDRYYSKALKLIKNDDTKYDEAESMMRNALAKSFTHSIDYNMKVMNNFDSPEFDNDLKAWFEHTKEFDMFSKKVETLSLKSILSRPFDNKEENLFDNIEFVNYLENINPHTFKEDLEDFFEEKLKTDILDFVNKNHPKKSLKKDSIKLEKEEVSKIEYIIRELIHAIKLHKLSNNMYEMIKLAARKLTVNLSDDSDIDTFTALNELDDDINKLIKDI
jgi:MoxR-like ATPase